MRAKQCRLVLSLIALSLLSLSGCAYTCTEMPERCPEELHLYAAPERSADELATIEDISGRERFREIRWPDGTLIYSPMHGNYFEPELTREGLGYWRAPDTFHLLPGEYRLFLESTRTYDFQRRQQFTSYEGLVQLEAGHRYNVDTELCYMDNILFHACGSYTDKKYVFLEDLDTGEVLLGLKPSSQSATAVTPAPTAVKARVVGAAETKIFLASDLSWATQQDGTFRSGTFDSSNIENRMLRRSMSNFFRISTAKWQKGPRILEITVYTMPPRLEHDKSYSVTEEDVERHWSRLRRDGVSNYSEYDCEVSFCATFEFNNQDCATFRYVTGPIETQTSDGKNRDEVSGYFCGEDPSIPKEISAILAAIQIRWGE